MDTAIVTITCPHCGGEVKGIQALSHEQTVPCTYCGRELHVPHVGEAFVREQVVREQVVREVVVEPQPSAVPQLRASISLDTRLVIVGALTTVMLIVLLASRSNVNRTVDQFDREAATRKACEDGCKTKCANAPSPQRESTGDTALDQDLERTMRDTDRTVCETDCELKTCWRKP